ncbi:hypothetical protein QFZ82_000526 [Streptomyces sp. V4I23]|uniref:hypothetical protein n=1 Tax=Streptomyces sp. V4I23 TaxID=3042282 RepID=UPI002782F59C|nr:hypothetical protein [Streptomyces sp. V4I23]MDQ1006041.1 hypothetical protein [Streptomyces sp. V4I23]
MNSDAGAWMASGLGGQLITEFVDFVYHIRVSGERRLLAVLKVKSPAQRPY